MPEHTPELKQLVPEKLSVTFSRSRIVHCLLLAIGVHLVLMALTSVGYVRDTWIDPEGAARRKAERLAAKKAEEEGAAPAPATGAGPGKPGTAAEPGTAATAGKTPEEIEMAKRKDAPVIKDITAKAKKGEIPKQPDDLGISIEDTNP
jgi:hypothetical protein